MWHSPDDLPVDSNLVLIRNSQGFDYTNCVGFGYYLHTVEDGCSWQKPGWWIRYEDNDFPAFEDWGDILAWMEIP